MQLHSRTGINDYPSNLNTHTHQHTQLSFSALWWWWWWWWLFPRVWGFLENVQQFIPRLHFSFFLKWRLARTSLFLSLSLDQSTVAQQAETTVTECSLMSCLWAHFLIDSHTLPGQRHSQPTPTLLGQGCTCGYTEQVDSLVRSFSGTSTLNSDNLPWGKQKYTFIKVHTDDLLRGKWDDKQGYK